MINYLTHSLKKDLQRKLFRDIKADSLYCLGGPQIKDYLGLYHSDIKHIYSYENDNGTFIQQNLVELDPRVKLVHASIITAPVDMKAFYDLDFCCVIESAFETIHKFRDCRFMVTLSMRTKGGAERTKSGFFEAVEETIQTEIGDIIITDKNNYLQTNYRDSSSMFTIFKLKSPRKGK
jgi:hypothetical protein